MIGHLRKTLTNKEATFYGQDVVTRSSILSKFDPINREKVNWSDVFEMAENFIKCEYKVNFQDQPISIALNSEQKIRVSIQFFIYHEKAGRFE